MVIWWLCWHRTILIRNITQKQYSQFPPVHDFGKPWWGVAYVPCMTNLRALYAWVIRWHVTCMLSLAEHWQGRRALSNHVCAHSVISMWHVVCLQHLARACSEQSRSTTVLPINHVIQMPQCLSGFVNHDYCYGKTWRLLCPFLKNLHLREDLARDCFTSTAPTVTNSVQNSFTRLRHCDKWLQPCIIHWCYFFRCWKFNDV